jgi:hypothetical protein
LSRVLELPDELICEHPVCYYDIIEILFTLNTLLFPSFYIGCGNMFRCQSTIIRPYFIKCLPTTTEQNNQDQLKSQLSQSQFEVKITMLNINKVKNVNTNRMGLLFNRPIRYIVLIIQFSFFYEWCSDTETCCHSQYKNLEIKVC